MGLKLDYPTPHMLWNNQDKFKRVYTQDANVREANIHLKKLNQ